MGITVREALKIGGLKSARVVAGEKGLDRKIDYVLTIDVPDAAKWIRGNELLLTAAYVFLKNPEMEKKFIYELVEKNCAALAIKPGRFIDAIPPQMIKVAEEKNFPLIELPLDISWHDIVNPIMQEILNKEASRIKRSQEIHNELMKVMIYGGGLNAIVSCLSYILNCPVLIVDESLTLLSFSDYEETKNELSHKSPLNVIEELQNKGILKKIKNYKKPIRVKIKSIVRYAEAVIAPVIVKDEVYGYIIFLVKDSLLDDLDLIAAEQAAVVTAIEILKMQAVKEAEGKAKREFFENIITGNLRNPQQITSRLKYYGINLKEDIVVIIMCINYRNVLNAEEKFKIVEKTLESILEGYIVIRRGEEIVIICSFSNDETIGRYDKISNICKVISESLDDEDIKFGISDFHNDVSDIAEGYKEARKAIELMDLMKNKTKIAFYKDFWIYDFILNCTGNKELIKFCDKRLLKLLEYDCKNKEENLLTTLRIYLDCMGRHNLAAKKLFIHRNTLNYRLNKIKEVLNCDLNDPSIRLKLEVSLRIIDLQQ